LPTAGNTATATSGIGDVAIAFGNGADATANDGTFDSAIANGTDSAALAGGDSVTDAGGTTNHLGNDDFASALGPHTIAESGGLFSETSSSNDIAMDLVRFGTTGSEAISGIGNFDLAAVFAEMFTATATNGDFLTDILPSL
jgi:hypothetical protein